jgi:MFS family permease
MANGEPTSNLAFMARALRHRNYRLFFLGQGTSLIGTWMTRVATGWLVYRLTGSAFLLGMVSFAGQLPTLLVSPFAGVIIDRSSRHRVLIVTQVLAMIQSALLAVLSFTHTIGVGSVATLQAVQGFINAFDTPARQSFVVEMVDAREDLPNAIALNSSLVNGARLVGPSIAGVIIASVGEGACFTIDAVSYLAVIASLYLMKVQERAPRQGARRRMRDELKEGFRYAAEFAPVRAVLLMVALLSVTSMPQTTLMPVFASNVLHGGPHTLGFLMGASGVGAVAGALWLASRRTVLGLGRVILIGAVGFGVGELLFASSRWLWASLLVLPLTGAALMVQLASSNTVLQTVVPEDKRGRVMSLYTMAFLGMAPVGSLVAGWLGAALGAPLAVTTCGAVTLLGAGWFFLELPRLRRTVRPVYVQLGILPEIAEGLSASTELTRPPEK